MYWMERFGQSLFSVFDGLTVVCFLSGDVWKQLWTTTVHKHLYCIIRVRCCLLCVFLSGSVNTLTSPLFIYNTQLRHTFLPAGCCFVLFCFVHPLLSATVLLQSTNSDSNNIKARGWKRRSEDVWAAPVWATGDLRSKNAERQGKGCLKLITVA